MLKSDFMNILPVGAELFHLDGWTERHEEANMVAFLNFANTPKKYMQYYRICHELS